MWVQRITEVFSSGHTFACVPADHSRECSLERSFRWRCSPVDQQLSHRPLAHCTSYPASRHGHSRCLRCRAIREPQSTLQGRPVVGIGKGEKIRIVYEFCRMPMNASAFVSLWLWHMIRWSCKGVYLSSTARDGIPLVVWAPAVWCPLTIIHPEIHSVAISAHLHE